MNLINFCEIGPKLCKDIPPNNVDPLQYLTPTKSEFSFRAIYESELNKVLQSLKLSIKLLALIKFLINY